MAAGLAVKPVTEIKREATRVIAELRASGRPVLITEHGRSAAVLLDVDSYGALLRRLEILEGIARGERAYFEGRVVPHGEAKKAARPVARRRALVWTAPALDDLDEIAAHIALDDPRAAARLVRRVLQGVERLRRFPDSGRWVPEAPRKTYREVIVASCRIIYRREGRKRLIVHVARGERRVRVERLGQEAG